MSEKGDPGKASTEKKAGTGEKEAPKKTDSKANTSPWPLRITVISLALVVGIIAWVVTSGSDDGESEPASAPVEARIVSEEELADIAATAGHPVYWAGPIADTELEATESPDGSVLVRYLEDGAEIEEGAAKFLAVGSYPMANAAKALDGFAKLPGAIVSRAPDGRELVTNKESKNSVYFTSPDNSVQIEVYDSSPEDAMSLARSGKIQPVD